MKIIYKITLSLVFFLLILSVTDFYLPESFIQDYIRGVFTETLGIIITLILIELILQNNRNKEQKENSKKGLLRATKMIKISLENYNRSSIDLITPWKVGEVIRKEKMDKDFSFNDIHDLFQINGLIIENSFSSKAEVYFERTDRLIETVRQSLYQVDLTNYPEFSNLLLSLIEHCEYYYPKNGILADMKSYSGNKPTKDSMRNMIKEYDRIPEYLPSNMINKYIRLYEMLIYLVDFNEKFEIKLSEINKN